MRIKAANNAVDAPDKSVTVSATVTGGRGVSAPSNQTLTITDDDATPTVTLVLSPSSISENGDSTTVTATLSGPSSEKVTLVVSAAAVSPGVAADFTLSANDTLTIAAGATTSTRTVRIKAVNNAVDAPDKSVTVSATVTGGNGVAAPSNQTLTITDDDGTPTVSLVLSPVVDLGGRRFDHRDRDAQRGVERKGDAGGVGDGGVAGGGLRLHAERERYADDRGRRDHKHRDGEDQGGEQRRRRPGQVGDRVGDSLRRQQRAEPGEPDP